LSDIDADTAAPGAATELVSRNAGQPRRSGKIQHELESLVDGLDLV
jgi:hypothetical protein